MGVVTRKGCGKVIIEEQDSDMKPELLPTNHCISKSNGADKKQIVGAFLAIFKLIMYESYISQSNASLKD